MGCLGLASRSAPLLLDDLLATARSLVVLEEIGNADNVGSIFRNAAAFGVDGIVLSHGCADPLYRKAIRTSMAATLRVPYSAAPAGDGWCQALVRLRSAGFQIIALTLDESAKDLDGFVRGTRRQRIALLLGSEGAGLSSAARREPPTSAFGSAFGRTSIRSMSPSRPASPSIGFRWRLPAGDAKASSDAAGAAKSGKAVDCMVEVRSLVRVSGVVPLKSKTVICSAAGSTSQHSRTPYSRYQLKLVGSDRATPVPGERTSTTRSGAPHT